MSRFFPGPRHSHFGDASVPPLRDQPAALIGSTDEQTMRWFILVVALLLYPAVVLLLLVATERSTFVAGNPSVAQQPNK
jgi:hypothetical protein